MLITFKEAAAKIKTANKILVTAHVQPDGDAIGSTLAAMQILRSIGKSAQVYIDDSVKKNLHALPHFDEIRRPKDGERFDADLMLVLDTSTDRIGNVRKLTDAPILNVDHHVTNKGDDGELYVETNAAATCLYTGLATDTGFFQFSNTGAETLAVASELINCGVSPNFISEQLESKSLAEVHGLRDALNSLKMFYGDKVAGMTLDHATRRQKNSTRPKALSTKFA